MSCFEMVVIDIIGIEMEWKIIAPFWIPNKSFEYGVCISLQELCFLFIHILYLVIPRDFFVLSHPHLLSNDAASFVYTGDLQSQMIRGSMRKKTSSWSQNLARSTSQKNKWERGCSFWLFPPWNTAIQLVVGMPHFLKKPLKKFSFKRYFRCRFSILIAFRSEEGKKGVTPGWHFFFENGF